MRRGHSLAEALCALALGGLLAVAAGLALGGTRRALERAELRDVGGRAEREAVAIVRHALAGGETLVARGDTAVELDLLLGAGVACAIGAREFLLPWPAGNSLTAMPQLPGPDDLVAVRGWTPPVADWTYIVLDSVTTRVDATLCSSQDGWRAADAVHQPLLRLVLADTVSAALEPGAELRFYRRGRFALYHAGGGDWMLGWRRCHPWSGACGPMQPVAGPLRSPSAGGFSVRPDAQAARWVLAARGVAGRGAMGTVAR